jgi:hypothetical protein
LEQTLGAALELLVLLDVFLTVLYARMGTGIISYKLARLIWYALSRISEPFGPGRGMILSFCGPLILVLLVAVWALGLSLGAALIMHPVLGAGIRAGNGETPIDFVTALVAGAGSLSLVGSSDFVPETTAIRLLFLFNSLAGMSAVSLTLTYLMQVYGALLRRNALGLQIDLLARETGDAAELIAGLGPEGRFESGYAVLATIASGATEMKEAHHFYPVLFYFRFRNPAYSISRSTLVAFDTVTLIKSGLDDGRYAWLKDSGTVDQLFRASMMLLITLEETFLPGGRPQAEAPPDAATLDRWRQRYFAALRRLRQAGIETVADEAAGAEQYLELRACWAPHIARLAPGMAYRPEEIDPATHALQAADQSPSALIRPTNSPKSLASRKLR